MSSGAPRKPYKAGALNSAALEAQDYDWPSEWLKPPSFDNYSLTHKTLKELKAYCKFLHVSLSGLRAPGRKQEYVDRFLARVETLKYHTKNGLPPDYYARGGVENEADEDQAKQPDKDQAKQANKDQVKKADKARKEEAPKKTLQSKQSEQSKQSRQTKQSKVNLPEQAVTSWN